MSETRNKTRRSVFRAETELVNPEVYESRAKEINFSDWIRDKFSQAFTENLVLDALRDLPVLYKYIFGTLSYCMVVGVFVLFFVSGYRRELKAKYMSLESSGICRNIPLQVSGTFLGTNNGHWSGDSKFLPQKAIYSMQFTKFQRTFSEYNEIMNDIKSELETVDDEAHSKDAAINLMYWMQWRFHSNDTTYLFQMAASPVAVFARDHVLFTLGTSTGTCDILPVTTYVEQANSLIGTEFDVNEFASSPSCVNVISPAVTGYIKALDGVQLSFELDLNTVTLCIAINMRLILPDDLLLLKSAEVTHSFNGVPRKIVAKEYMDSRYPGMSPVYCIEISPGDISCHIVVGKNPSLIGYPTLNSIGDLFDSSKSTHKKCECPLLTADDFYNCNSLNLMLGVIVYNIDSFTNMIDFLSSYGDSAGQDRFYAINDDSYYAAVGINLSPKNDSHYNSSAFDFCVINNSTCSMLLFSTFDTGREITAYRYQLEYMACNRSFLTTSWNQLAINPPTELVEVFLECHASWSTAAVDNIGIAFGNAQVLVPLFFMLCMPLIFKYLESTDRLPLKPEYEDTLISEANKALAITILRIRDGKLRGIRPGSTIENLSKDLMTAAKTEGGYVDSDDESDYGEGEKIDPKDVPIVIDNNLKDGGHIMKLSSRDKLPSRVFVKKTQKIVEANPKAAHAPNDDNTNQSNSGFFGFFSGRSNKKPAIVAEPSKLEIVYTDNIEVQVLNKQTDKKTLIFENVDVTLAYLNDIHTMMSRAHEFQNIDGARSYFAKVEAKVAELQHLNLNSLSFSNQDLKRCYKLILDTLALNASIVNKCSVEEVLFGRSESVGYNIGGRVYCAAECEFLSTEDSNPTKAAVTYSEVSKL